MADDQPFEGRVKLNVGGTIFETSLSTLTKYSGSMFSALVADRWQQQEELFIDRNSTYFAKVLDYLRDGEYVVLPEDYVSLKCLRREAEFYNLPGLVELCSSKLLEKHKHPSCGERVKINVGGVVFTTSFTSVNSVKDSLLSAMVADRQQKEEEVFIDRDPTHFAKVLNYLREGERFLPPSDDDTRESLRSEAEFYNLPDLAQMCACHAGDVVKWTTRAITTYALIPYTSGNYKCINCNLIAYKGERTYIAVNTNLRSEQTPPLGSDWAFTKGRVMAVNSICCRVKFTDNWGEFDVHAPKSALHLANSR
ncbi:unnamed protein product [Cylicocyclus nassatus]|uniref:BTB domain-containing protein n=1 Tax=Cylicocyclus nassatus TaxID=53992 RepID=A0AA36DRT5_CYLNA|nr:unnamed protein product [Cylicocyclus nassatus]